LYKSSRAGNTISAQVTLTELRQIADDMNAYFNYGLNITNVLGIKALGLRPISGTTYEWPAKPALPRKLEYKSHNA
jgi:hypothetical protein